MLDGPSGFHGTISATAANPLLGLDPGVRADAYVFPGDGGGPILVEVGSMRRGKWNHVVWPPDGRPLRVLRISYELGVGWLNRRGTQFEADLEAAIEDRLRECLSRAG